MMAIRPGLHSLQHYRIFMKTRPHYSQKEGGTLFLLEREIYQLAQVLGIQIHQDYPKSQVTTFS